MSSELLDRRDPEVARQILESLYHDPATRQYAKERLAQTLDLADGIEPGGWSITFKPDLVRLIAGRILIIDLRFVGLTIVTFGLSGSQLKAITMWGVLVPFESFCAPFSFLGPRGQQ